MGIFGNSPTTLPFPIKENVIQHPDNYPQKRTILVSSLYEKPRREVVYLYRFSVFIHVLLFIYVEIFVSLLALIP